MFNRRVAFARLLWTVLPLGAAVAGVASGQRHNYPPHGVDSAAWVLVVLPAAFVILLCKFLNRNPFSELANFKVVNGESVPNRFTSYLLEIQPFALFGTLLLVMGVFGCISVALSNAPVFGYFSQGFFVSGGVGCLISRRSLKQRGDQLG